MKRALVLSLVLAVGILFSALAGPYFVVEQNPTQTDATLLVGWDFEAPNIDFSNLSMTGDFWFEDTNIWDRSSLVALGADLGVKFCSVTGYDYFFIDGEMVFTGDPDTLGLDAWTAALKLTGQPSEVVKIYGGISFTFDFVADEWGYDPLVGIECRWP